MIERSGCALPKSGSNWLSEPTDLAAIERVQDANQRSSEIRLFPKPRRAYKDIMFEPEQPVLPKETSMNAKTRVFSR